MTYASKNILFVDSEDIEITSGLLELPLRGRINKLSSFNDWGVGFTLLLPA